MFPKRRAETGNLRVLAAVLGVFVLAAAPRATKITKVASEPGLKAAVPAPESGCPVLDALDKLYTTPFHVYVTQTSPGIANGKPMNSETVFADGARYVMVNGRWIPSPLSTEQMRALDERNRKNARNASCRYVRDELVNGESAALYNTHSESDHGTSDNQFWISKSQALLLRQETDLDTGQANGKSHLSARYEYANVQAPKLTN